MTGFPISTRQALLVAAVFVGLVAGFGILSAATGWPDGQSWGLIVVLSLVVAVIPLIGPLLVFIRDSGAVIKIRGVTLDFSKSAQHGPSIVGAELMGKPGVPITDSDAASVAEAAQAAKSAAFIVVDLGTGQSWYPTRLFALAAAAEELDGARAIVILAQSGGMAGRFVGWITPADAVAAFCQRDERYGLALRDARAILAHLRLSGGWGTYKFPAPYQSGASFRRAYIDTGDLAIVPVLIGQMQSTSIPPDPYATKVPADPDPTAPEPLEQLETPKWLSREEVERWFDPWLVRTRVGVRLSATEKRATLLQTRHSFIAVTDDDERYRGLIDMDEVVRSALVAPASMRDE